MTRKGIILAGGSGTRLHPITLSLSKQLLPIYDKPMIYYSLSVLMLAGLREIAIITTPRDQGQFRELLGDGSQWGLAFTYLTQDSPDGIAQAYLIAEDYLDGAHSALILGDNLYFGQGLTLLLEAASTQKKGASVFGYQVSDPERYAVATVDPAGQVTDITEKPSQPASRLAVTGLYFCDETAPDRARQAQPSARGELEITDVLNSYLQQEALSLQVMGRGYAWLDTGTHDSLLEAANFVRTLEKRQGLQTGAPEEIAFHQGWIGKDELRRAGAGLRKNAYGQYLLELAEDGELRRL